MHDVAHTRPVAYLQSLNGTGVVQPYLDPTTPPYRTIYAFQIKQAKPLQKIDYENIGLVSGL
jgi:hypothetical protein